MGRARRAGSGAAGEAEGVVALHRLPEIRTFDRRKMLRELVPVWKAAGDIQRVVGMVFGYHKPEVDALRGVLLEQARMDYGAAIAAEARAAGYGVANVGVLDQRVLTELNQRSQFAAQSIAATHNADLRRQIARIRADVPKANRWVYASRLEAWEKNRAAWKSSQIAATELGETMQRAKTDFAVANAVGAKARVMPETAGCPACAEYIGHGWMDLSAAMMYPLPLHVGCVHYLEIEYDRAGMPRRDELWLGGQELPGPGGMARPMSPVDWLRAAGMKDPEAQHEASLQALHWMAGRYQERGLWARWSGKLRLVEGHELGLALPDGSIALHQKVQQDLLSLYKKIGTQTLPTKAEMDSLSTALHELMHGVTPARGGAGYYGDPLGRALEEGLTEAYSSRMASQLWAEMSGQALAGIPAAEATPLYGTWVEFAETAARKAGATTELGITDKLDQWKKLTPDREKAIAMIKEIEAATGVPRGEIVDIFKLLKQEDPVGSIAGQAVDTLARLRMRAKAKSAARGAGIHPWVQRQGRLLATMTVENADRVYEEAEALIESAPSGLRWRLARGLEIFYMLREAYRATDE